MGEKLSLPEAQENKLCCNMVLLCVRGSVTDVDDIKAKISPKFTSKEIDDAITTLKADGRLSSGSNVI